MSDPDSRRASAAVADTPPKRSRWRRWAVEIGWFMLALVAIQWRQARGGEERRIDAAARLRLNDSIAVRDAPAKGLGVAQPPLLVAAPGVEAGRLVPVLPDWLPPPVPAHALFPSARCMMLKVRAFVDHAVAAFGAGNGAG